jgi:hypothetical protein
VQIIAPTSTPITSPVSVPQSEPLSIPVTVPIPVPAPVPAPVPVPVPVPIPVPAPVPVPVPVLPPSNYNIDLDLVGVSTSDQAFFTNAKSRWESIIRGELTDILTSTFDPPSQGCVYPVIVDDLYICSRFVAMDGPGRVLGFAGPTYIRSANRLTITGEMEFDSADIASLKSNGNFETVILHEMGHILGM